MLLPSWLPARASLFFFLIIILQIPLFRFPCKSGYCVSPLEIAAGQLAASQLVPSSVVKAILFPGACVFQASNGHTPIKVWKSLLEDYNMTDIAAPSADALPRLEVLAGSYFVVAGAVVSLVKPGRMSMFGTLLIVWGLLKETLLLKPDSIEGRKAGDNSIRLEPMLFVVLVLAVLSIRFDATKVQRLVRPVAKPLKSSAKIKVK
ncbi:unnamed protein product [Sphagnum jensenii]|uniref:Uncharacterized protein n=1 Tax=Sphagnum jensenii TaxID=128206 RepID=A0ABP0VZI7_9BRYO